MPQKNDMDHWRMLKVTTLENRFEEDTVAEALKKAGSTVVQHTEYPGVGHNSWDKTYNDAKVVKWLLAQRRGARGK